MPPKRKRRSSSIVEPPGPLPPDGLRRSNRRSRGPENEGLHNKPQPPAASGGNRGRERTRLDIGLKNKEDVQRAMRELGEMEEKLQNAVRSQRLAVESSDLHVDVDESANAAFLPRRERSVKAVINDKGQDPIADEEIAPVKEDEAEAAMKDVERAKKEEDEDMSVADRGARRPPPVNSDCLPLPWKGRLGYACLNTYLRTAKVPVFSSRTCRISSIIEHRHPLADPSQPEHPTKNRPDKDKPASVERGMKYVQDLGLANARDIVKMIKWNHKYGINFMRLSSEMFPFASHDEYGYRLAPFASEALAEAGKLAGALNQRLTTHPGQFTQIASPRKQVVMAAIRDLEYHDEMLSLLKLPDQLNRDAVMILHMGGTYGDKAATLDRFRENYLKLPQGVKNRLVLENDDVSWSVHELLPVCEELNIPLVLDYHHHNIIFDDSVREGNLDIMQLYDRIRATWTRKGITQKMHYSEPTAPAVTPRDRRKHSARVKTLPPCAQDMDLMIEAKDKEQAVFELMRTFRLPGWDLFNDVVPYERDDEPKQAIKKKPVKKSKKAKKVEDDEGHDDNDDDDIEVPEKKVNPEDVSMGGPERRVYWPEGMEEWLKPKKREVNGKNKTKAEAQADE